MTTYETPEETVQATVETPVARPADTKSRSRATAGLDRLKELDLRNTWQVAAGAVLLPLGGAVIYLGWHGAAYGNVDQKQIPYLISGGILGLAIVIVGCFFYWAHWLYRIYDQADLHHQDLLRQQAEMMDAFMEAVAQRALDAPDSAPSRNGSTPAPDRPASGRIFLATPTGTNVHRPGCSMIANRMENIRQVDAAEAGTMRPCRICEPLG